MTAKVASRRTAPSELEPQHCAVCKQVWPIAVFKKKADGQRDLSRSECLRCVSPIGDLRRWQELHVDMAKLIRKAHHKYTVAVSKAAAASQSHTSDTTGVPYTLTRPTLPTPMQPNGTLPSTEADSSSFLGGGHTVPSGSSYRAPALHSYTVPSPLLFPTVLTAAPTAAVAYRTPTLHPFNSPESAVNLRPSPAAPISKATGAMYMLAEPGRFVAWLKLNYEYNPSSSVHQYEIYDLYSKTFAGFNIVQGGDAMIQVTSTFPGVWLRGQHADPLLAFSVVGLGRKA